MDINETLSLPISSTARLIYFYLLENSDDSISFARNKEMSEIIGVNITTISNNLSELEANNIISRSGRGMGRKIKLLR